jgi:hypothetical protein
VSLSLLLSSPQYAHVQPVQRRNVRLLKEKEIYKLSYLSSYEANVQKSGSSSVGGILGGILKKLSQKKDMEMEQQGGRAMLEPEVFKITEVPLTKWGQIRLCAFPAHIISSARLTFDKTLTGRHAFDSFFKEAMDHCRKNNIQPDFKRVLYLAQYFKQPDNAKMVLDKALTQQEKDSMAEERRYHQNAFEGHTRLTQKDKKIQPPTTPSSYPLRELNSNPHKRTAVASHATEIHSHKREAYKPWNESEENKRATELIYISYFNVQEGFKNYGNPLGLPNPFEERYEQYLEEALASTNVPRETMEDELYAMYLRSDTYKQLKAKLNRG